MDAETQTSDCKRGQLELKAHKESQDANNRRERLRRSLYFGSQTVQQRSYRLKKQRERSRKNRAMKTEEEKDLMREKINKMKQEKRARETSNQKFWRLIRRRKQRKMGYNLLSIEFEYHRSTHHYGIDIDFAQKSDFVIGLSDDGFKTVFLVFDEMLNLARTGKPIPTEKFKIFDHYGIYLPESFFKNYIKDLAEDLDNEL